MMKFTFFVLGIVFIIQSFSMASTMYPSATSHAPNIQRILVFGDSLFDTGNLNKIDPKMAPEPYYYKGRFSNKYNIIDYLQRLFKLPVQNYAVGGALLQGESKQLKKIVHGRKVSILKQIEQYPKPFQKTDLILVDGGGNDIFAHWFAPHLAKKWKIVLHTLIEKGAKNIIILNTPNVSLTPLMHVKPIIGFLINPFIQENIRHGNRALNSYVNIIQKNHPHIHIIVFDFYQYVSQFIKNNASHINICQPCIYSVGTKPKKGTICKNPNNHMFWDLIHPSTKYDQMIAKKMYQQWEESLKDS